MPLSPTTAKTVTATANNYVIPQLTVAFFQGGGPLEKCTIAVETVLGNENPDGTFTELPGGLGNLPTAYIRDADAMTLLSTPVSALPQNVSLLEAMISLLDATLKERGVV